MPPRFEIPESPGGSERGGSRIDLEKRYDVYCTDPGNKWTVHENVKIKGKRMLFDETSTTITCRFVELEQLNGESLFVSEFTITMFCEHGTEIQ